MASIDRYRSAEPTNAAEHDRYLGEKVYEVQTIYKLIDNLLSDNVIIQSNREFTADELERLYRTRNSVIASHALYGAVSQKMKKELVIQTNFEI
jgi:hypothetical protein